VIERVIEHWLAKVNERGYEMALCQALTAQGHTILRRPAHGGTEHGKDIVSRDRQNKYHCYQLKTGNLSKSEWRAIRDEVAELVEVPIQESNVPQNVAFTPHLVTNGTVTDPVSLEVKARNGHWKRRGFRPLDLILKDNLFRMFLDLQGKFLPSTPTDFEVFLRLYLGDKTAPLNRDEFCLFLSSFLPNKALRRKAELSRALAATAILSSYILTGYQEHGNHLAIAEGWMLVLAHMLRLAEQHQGSQADWMQSVTLCRDAWEGAVRSLVDEAVRSPNWIEGDPMVDNSVHGIRSVLLLGYLSCDAIYNRRGESPPGGEDNILVKVKENLNGLSRGYWGESASPFVFAVILFLWLRGDEELAVKIAADLIGFIARENHPNRRLGVPSPYYEPSRLLAIQFGEDFFDHRQTFVGRSFTMQWFVEFVARRGRKRLLKTLWADITHITKACFVPDELRDFYFWSVKKGTEVARQWGRPQRWEALVEQSNLNDLPRLLLVEQFPDLVLPFLLVYPHRATAELMRFVERRASQNFGLIKAP